MFLTGNSGYDRYGGQRASGNFLMLFCIKSGGELRALVRSVKMHQCGHFMMGRVKIRSDVAKAENELEPGYMRHVRDGHFMLSLSGTYGSDGLPLSADDCLDLWDLLHPVPAELCQAFWKGGGHNSAGSEGPAMREWAQKNARELSKLRVRPAGAQTSQEAT